MRVAQNITQALEIAADGGRGYVFVNDEGTERARSYAEVFEDARRTAGGLLGLGLRRGDRVAIIVPEAEGFLNVFFGAALAGLVPIPMSPPLNLGQLDAFLAHAVHILRSAQVKAVVTVPQVRRLLGSVQASTSAFCPVVCAEDLAGAPLERVDQPSSDDTAFIQFTSGSTSQPKGVVLSHGNLHVNIKNFSGPHGLAVNAEVDSSVSWLPLFHDMGLIAMALAPLYLGAPAVIMSPLLFLKRPITWLRAFARHGATISCVPNFAYSLCVKRVPDKEVERLDLSSWRVAGCGAEPIQAEVLQQFAKKFAPAGFRETAFLPCYGMAEHTVGVTYAPRDRPLRVDVVSGTVLGERKEAIACSPDEHRSVQFVSCGRPFPDHQLRIVDDRGHTLGERRVGEIQLAGPSVMKGYDGRPDLTAEIIRDGWLRTGDLGYLHDGELFVCGRKKDVIILNGRNYAPQDLEWLVSELPGVRKGSVVAFGTDAFGGREKVVVVAEARQAEGAADLAEEIRQKILVCLQIQVDDAVVVPPGTIPKTTSGKLQRSRVRERYEAGELLRPRTLGKGKLLWHLAASQIHFLVTPMRRRLAEVGWWGMENKPL